MATSSSVAVVYAAIADHLGIAATKCAAATVTAARQRSVAFLVCAIGGGASIFGGVQGLLHPRAQGFRLVGNASQQGFNGLARMNEHED